MATVLSFLSGRQITNNNGVPQAGALIYHYQAGTTNNLTVYSNQAGSVAHAQPVVCDAGGFVPLVYVDSTSDWKVVVQTALGVTLQTYDNLPKAVAEVSAADFAPPLLEWTQVNSAASPVALTAADAGKAYEANTTAGSIEFDLPSAASVGNGKGFWFKKTASANTLTLDPNGSETIDDSSTSLAITRQYQTTFLASNGAEWYVAAEYLEDVSSGRITATFINGLTEDATPDKAADFLLSWDASASTHKKVQVGNVSKLTDFKYVTFEGDNGADLSGTYVRSGNTVTVTATAHGYSAGHSITFDATTGTAADGVFLVASVIDANNFTFTHGTSGATSGNCTLHRSAILSSFGVANVTHHETGVFTVNFSTPMSTATYALTGTGDSGSDSNRINVQQQPTWDRRSVNCCDVVTLTGDTSTTRSNTPFVCVMFFA